MKKLTFLFLTTTFLYLTSCGDSGNKNSKLKNEASITIKHIEAEDTSKTPKQFPSIPEPLILNINEVTNTEGSFSSIEMHFDNTIEGVNYKLFISLPACDKFGMRNNHDGSIEFITDDLPCTIEGKDYKPYPNALDGGAHHVRATLEVSGGTGEWNDFLDFKLDQLTIYEINEEKGKFSASFDFKGAPGDFSTSFYGPYSASISINIRAQEISLMMVD